MIRPDLAAPLRTLLAEEPGTLVGAWLFGSRARGEGRPGSDVDVGARKLAMIETYVREIRRRTS